MPNDVDQGYPDKPYNPAGDPTWSKSSYVPPAPINERAGLVGEQLIGKSVTRVTDNMAVEELAKIDAYTQANYNRLMERRSHLESEMDRIRNLLEDTNVALDVMRNTLQSNPYSQNGSKGTSTLSMADRPAPTVSRY